MDNKQAEFTRLYLECKNALERFVHYKISNYSDAEDVLQDVLSSAFISFDKLSEKNYFKRWIIGIASHKCVDYYKKKAKILEIPLDFIQDKFFGIHENRTCSLVQDTLEMLSDKDKQILYLFYIKEFSQKDISMRLNIPLGTVKSRVSSAKKSFKELYPFSPKKSTKKGNDNMKNNIFPEFIPEIKIKKSDKKPFSVRFEEIAGWLITPRVGEKSNFAFYDDPNRILTGVSKMECIRNAEIHGIPCVQVEVEEYEENKINKRTLFLRMTETHCMYIAEMIIRNGTFYFGSFMDDEWLERYEVGENNCGREIFQEQRGIITVDIKGNFIVKKEETPDIIGRYTVCIGSRIFDTVALVTSESGIFVIQYIDENGKTILFRRYNKDDWKLERYIQKWTDKLPDSETFKVNSEKYVHWYDCIADYVL